MPPPALRLYWWSATALPVLLGALAALGFAPLQLWPLTLGALVAWLALVHAAPSWRAAAWRGWLFGFGHFTVNDNWFQHAFDFQDAMPPALGWVAPPALALYLALYPTLAAALAWRGRGRGGPDAAFALAAGAAWIATEYARAKLLTGYAWDPLAVVWVPVQPVAALTAWVGTYALSGLTIAAAALLLAVPGRRWRWLLAGTAAGVLLTAQHVSFRAGSPAAPAPDTPWLRVVQPDISQDARGDEDAEPTLRAQLALSGRAAPHPRLVIWPEGMVRDFIDPGYPGFIYAGRTPWRIRPRLVRPLGPRDLLALGDTPLLFDADGEVTAALNATTVLDARGRTVGRYAKAHLVPYGEYLPASWLLKPLGLARLVPGDLDFERGPGPRTLDLPGFGPVGFQTCYEIVFSGQVIDRAHRPRLLVNPSDDAWFGRWGPPQHLAQARLRAIEEGVPIVRATPTGISAVIGADGALLATVPAGRAGAIDAPIPPALPPTLFARVGNWAALAVALLLAGGAIALRRRGR